MDKKLTLIAIISFGVLLQTFCQHPSTATGQQNIIDPNARPEVFIQEGVAVPNDESAPTFMPDEKTLYLADSNRICFSRLVNGKWTKPVVAPFSGQWQDWDPFITPDGKRLIFVSNRPLEGMPPNKPHSSNHLWYTGHLSGNDWSTPRHLDSPVNIEGLNDYGPSVSSSGTICFCSRNRDGHKGMGAYSTKWLGDHYDKPQLLALNGDSDVYDPCISPDESYIIFSSNKNLCISYRQGKEWSAGQRLSATVNTGSWNGGPYVSPDGKRLYYSQQNAPGILMIPISIPPH